MATVNFLIRSKKNPATIHIRVREGVAVDIKTPTPYLINPRYWSHAKGQPQPKDNDLKNLKANLDNLRATIISRLNQRDRSEVISSNWIQNIISPPTPIEEHLYSNNLALYFDVYIEKKKNGVSSSTIKKFRVIQRLIERMEKHLDSPILIEHVNIEFKEKFESYCKSESYAPNTTSRAIKFIKTVCLHARAYGLKTHHQLDLIKGKFQSVNHIHLTFTELDQIATTKLEHDYLDNARDWLIISCYTGQRVSDFLRFDKSMIRIENKKRLIEFTQTKTEKIMAIPIHPEVDKILLKRKGEFPRKISDQKYNEYIKVVCKEAKLTNKVNGSRRNKNTNRKESGLFEKWKLITSHIGRRSFATNFYGKIPTSLLKSATGHSSEKQFLAYIGKTDTEQAKQLADYF